MNDQKQLSIGLNRLGGFFQQEGRVEEAIAAFERQIKIDETLNDQKSLTIGLNCLGRLFQKEERVEEAIVVFERQIKISELLNDQKSLSIGLGALGTLLSQKGDFFNAIHVLRRLVLTNTKFSNVIEKTKSQTRLENTLYIVERKCGIKSAEIIFRESYDLAFKEQDLFAQMIISKILGEMFSKHKGEENLSLTNMYFANSIKISRETEDTDYLFKVYILWGNALIHYGKLGDALTQLNQAFEIEERSGMANIHRSRSILSSLTNVLTRLGRSSEIQEYLDRAIVATNNSPELIEQREAFVRSMSSSKKPVLRKKPHEWRSHHNTACRRHSRQNAIATVTEQYLA